MSGIYIHIPYCKQKCSYCNFYFSTDTRSKTEMVNSVCKEIELRKNEINDSIETIYFGGGTPSLLDRDEFKLIFEKLYS
ncbi:MAG: radical SAM protein, partial [Moheibacter sp.]